MEFPLSEGGEIEFLTFDKSEEARQVFWHSTSHIMAQAVKALFPDVRVAIGPSIETGFYYDFDREQGFTQDELTMIEKKMEEIIKQDQKFTCEVMPAPLAREYFEKRAESYKVELIDEIAENTEEPVTFYHSGDFTDLCRGPHIPSAGRIKAFKLLSVAGAYWRGLESNKMLSRIYGVSYPKKKLLDEYLVFLEEAKARDHRRLGQELDLYMTDENIGPGLILWKPKGSRMRRIIEKTIMEEHDIDGYEYVYTPHIARFKLWETSGHSGFYNKNMFKPIEVEGGLYQIRPMNCPFHIAMFNSELHSYKDLPVRWAELGGDYRYERSGVLHGLMRVRGFTMDDAHIFCTKKQCPMKLRAL
jgi:threonyl-tRNA synthetase